MAKPCSTVFVTCLLFLSGATAMSYAGQFIGDVDVATATTVAQHHLDRSGVADSFAIAGVQTVSGCDDSATLCYCFDLRPAGYVVVAADAALPPVVAYSFTSPYPCDLSPGTPLADLLRWDLRLRLENAELRPDEVVRKVEAAWAAALAPASAVPERRFEQWPPAGTTPTGGWLEENWHQGAPYNNLCPMDLVAGKRSIAGCPAIAMGLILDYHQRLNATHFDDGDDYYHNYGGNQYWIDDAYLAREFPSYPQLNGHLDLLFDEYFYGKTPTDTHIAALVFACGVAARQVYTASASGTFGVDQALDAYQRFNCDTVELLDESNPDLYQRLSQNMKDALPAHLAVVDPAWSYGHNLVVDGYNTDDYYHLNFGWNGSYNGWYVIPSGIPYGLTVLEGVIVDIMAKPCAPMDANCDADVDWHDFVYFVDCFTGPAGSFSPPGCTAFDGDADADVDLGDFSVLQAAFGG